MVARGYFDDAVGPPTGGGNSFIVSEAVVEKDSDAVALRASLSVSILPAPLSSGTCWEPRVLHALA
jgi:hypothetical protein